MTADGGPVLIIAADQRDAETAVLSLGLSASGYVVVTRLDTLRGRASPRVHVTRRASERRDYPDICDLLVRLQRLGGLRYV